jgi:hypothetical protein
MPRRGRTQHLPHHDLLQYGVRLLDRWECDRRLPRRRSVPPPNVRRQNDHLPRYVHRHDEVRFLGPPPGQEAQ